MKKFECATRQLADSLWYCSTTREIDKFFTGKTPIEAQVSMEEWLNSFGDKGLYSFPVAHVSRPRKATARGRLLLGGFDRGMV